MKTIKQIADEIGVSKQAVAKRISRQPLCTRIHPCIQLIGNTKYIDEIGENVVKQAFLKNVSIDVGIDMTDNQSTTNRQLIDDVIVVLNATIDTLQKQLDVKDGQLAVKDEQLERFDKRLAETTTALQTAQMLHADTKKLLPKRKLRLIEPPSIPPMGGLKKFCLKIFTREKM